MFRENKLGKSHNLLLLNIKSINPVQKATTHYWIIILYSIFRVHAKFIKNCNLDPYYTLDFKNKDTKERQI